MGYPDRHSAALATTVLTVDDDEDIRESLREVFEDEGYRVIEARDGLMALKFLRAMPFPMVMLSNHNMPRLDGPRWRPGTAIST